MLYGRRRRSPVLTIDLLLQSAVDAAAGRRAGPHDDSVEGGGEEEISAARCRLPRP